MYKYVDKRRFFPSSPPVIFICPDFSAVVKYTVSLHTMIKLLGWNPRDAGQSAKSKTWWRGICGVFFRVKTAFRPLKWF